MTPRPIRVLFIEDSEDDVLLELRELRKGGFDPSWERVDTETELRAAVAHRPWDLVISDHGMPGFNSTAAFAVVREKDPDVPFLIVSGTIGEGPAVEAMRGGVQDYILKGALSRLAAAVRRELGDAETRKSRRDAEAALRHAQARHKDLVAKAVLGIYRAHLDGRFEDANEALLSMLGHASADELLARAPQDVFDEAGAAARLHAEWFQSGSFRRVECVWRRADGRKITVRLSGRLVAGPVGAPSMFEVFVEDVTEQKTLEAQYLQSQKLEALGQLVGGVAHDFNNLLTVIGGYSCVFLEEASADDPRRAELETISQASDRAAVLVRQLLAFSRREAVEPRALDLNDVVLGLEKMLGRVVPSGVWIETSLAPGLPLAVADPGQIEVVLMNLVVNARDAIDGTGRIRVATCEEDVAEPLVRRGGVVPAGRWVVLRVSDTGSGIDDATLARVFEPFFTTKGRGKGTGLGLATVMGVVRQAGGHVFVDTRLGEGTTFSIHLPRAPDGAAAAAPAHVAGAAGRGTETVLLADGDDVVRRLLAGVLRGRGYRVIEASDGRRALDGARRHEGALDILVSDTRLPDMTGGALAGALAGERPATRVLFATGFPGEGADASSGLASAASLLLKPFTPAQFAAKVRETLDRTPTP